MDRKAALKCRDAWRTLLLPLVLGIGVACAADPVSPPAPPQFKEALPLTGASEQVTFLYYADLAAPREFYGKVLGLQAYYDNEWVTLYRVATGAAIGVVKASGTGPAAEAKRDALMVSIVTTEVDAWFDRLSRRPGIVIQKPIYDHPAVPIRAFLLQDPGGYSVEFFQWRK